MTNARRLLLAGPLLGVVAALMLTFLLPPWVPTWLAVFVGMAAITVPVSAVVAALGGSEEISSRRRRDTGRILRWMAVTELLLVLPCLLAFGVDSGLWQWLLWGGMFSAAVATANGARLWPVGRTRL